MDRSRAESLPEAKCSECGGDVRIIACIEDPEVIRKILAHLDEKVTPTGTGLLPESRAPPATGLFFLKERNRYFTKLAAPYRKQHGICRLANRNWRSLRARSKKSLNSASRPPDYGDPFDS